MMQLIYGTDPLLYENDEFLGVSRIHAYLTLNKYSCSIVDFNYTQEFINQKDKIDLDCKVFGFALYDDSVKFLSEVMRYIKENIKDAVIFAGSIFSANCYELLFNDFKEIDFIVLGHGEYTIKEVLDNISNSSNIKEFLNTHKNIVTKYTSDNKIKKEARYIDIKDLPLPTRNFNKNTFYANICTKHGCSGQCFFCCVTEKKSSRENSCIFNEVTSIHKNYGIRCFNFIDSSIDDFGSMGKENLNNFCDKIINYDKKLSFRCYIRANSFKNNEKDISLLEKMIKSGFYNLYVGIESVNENDLKVYNKKSSADENEFILNQLVKYGLDPKLGFIMINPYSTRESIYQNYNFLIKHGITNLNNYITILDLYYNSELYKKVKEDGLLKESYHYITNLSDYNFTDPFIAELTDFINTYFITPNIKQSYNIYTNFGYFLSYMFPLLEDKALSIAENKKEIDIELCQVFSEYLKTIIIEQDLSSAKKNWADFESKVCALYNKSARLSNKLIRHYLSISER